MKKAILAAFITVSVLLSFTACDNVQPESSVSSAETTLDMEQAMKDLDKYCSGHPVCMRLDSDEYPEQNIIYDFTGDGYDDLVTGFQYGSGIVRVAVVLYDVANQVFYPVGNGYDSYKIVSFEDGILTVEEYVYPDQYTMGTVEFKDNEFVFVANSRRGVN
ncbi:hypothetical protein SAMN02910456_02403 [Ruminococcaceae bacterium YRB3002]|nr:hypothetical protein SAMN02910456_02403 [Ruminococcaceae bacterium YRB3002]